MSEQTPVQHDTSALASPPPQPDRDEKLIPWPSVATSGGGVYWVTPPSAKLPPADGAEG
jgi:hypothetical protein